MADPVTIGFAAVAAGGAIYGGVTDYLDSRKNAEELRRNAIYNSTLSLLGGEYNASAATAMANFNAGASLLGANVSAELTYKVADFNARLQRSVKEYDAQQYERESQLIWEEADLAIFQYEQRARQAQGTAVVQYGASGVVIDAIGDTPNTMLVDMKSQAQLDVMIYRHGADISAHKMIDSANRSRWEGEMTARKFMFEGIAAGASTKLNAAIGAAATRGQGALNSEMIRWSAFQEAENILRNGNFSADQTNKAGTQALFSGFFNASNSIGKAYGAGAFGKPSPTTTNQSLLSGKPIS